MSNEKFEDVYALTPMQQGMLFHTLYAPESGVYVLQLGCTIEGPLRADVFRNAWQTVVDRHPVLRTAFVWRRAEEPKQVVAREARVDVETLDWSELEDEEQERRFEKLVESDRQQGFKLTKPPLMRVRLVKTGPKTHRLLWSKHHLLLDGWSHQLIMSQVLNAYIDQLTGATPARQTAGMSFGDYVRYIERQDRVAAERAWREELRGFERANRIVVLGSLEASRGPDGDFENMVRQIPVGIASALRSTARRLKITENTLFQGAWSLVLAAYSGDSDIVFGSTVSGRSVALPGCETAVGMFVNTLPTRVHVAPAQPIESWLVELQARQVELRSFEYASLSEIRRVSEVPAGDPLFESILVYENYPIPDDFVRPASASGDALPTITDVWSSERINYPLTLVVSPRTYQTTLSYDRRRFSNAVMERIRDHVFSALEAVTRPGALVRDGLRLPEEQRIEETITFNDTALERSEEPCVHQIIERLASRAPDAVAVADASQQMSYGALNRRANQLARYLRSRGVRRGSRVGVLIERSADLVVALLAVLKSGAAFVPLDPSWPADRMSFVTSDAELGRLLTTASVKGETPSLGELTVFVDAIASELETLPGGDLEVEVAANDAAYAIYTSGSTGRPKAAVLPHAGLVNSARGMAAVFDMSSKSRLLQFASVAFDGCVADIFITLTSGSTLWLATQEASLSASAFVELLRSAAITNVTLPPSFLRLVPVVDLPDLAVVTCVGERCPPELVERWQPGRRMVNGYGPTEVTIAATVFECSKGIEPLIGKPLPNVRAYVLGPDLEPVPLGVAAELYVGGRGIAHGYLSRFGLTAERFVPDPFSEAGGERMYATGDVVRRREDGNLEFVGRRDEQVKVRGYRVELREIEEVLGAQERIKESAVVVQQVEDGGERLVAYVVPVEGSRSIGAEVRRDLAAALPSYMVPAEIVELTEMPRNASGKIDRRVLRERRTTLSAASSPEAASPVSETEGQLLQIWRRVLRRDTIGRDDDFFEVAGGDSLLAVRMVAEVEKRLGRKLSVNVLFENPTLSRLTAVLEGSAEDSRGKVAERTSWTKPTLDAAIAPSRDLAGEPGRADRPFLTGATGFLGSHLLHELLERTRGPVHCLVRARNDAEALQRIRESLDRHELDCPDLSRVIPVVGDLARPRLGLSAEAYAMVASETDTIIHNGASVNFFLTEERLYPTNVGGTEEVLRLSASRRPKTVHVFSTPGAMPFDDPRTTLRETDALPDVVTPKSEWITKYAKSKWAAEVLVDQARARGLAVVTYRMAHIGGHSRTGVSHGRDAIMLMLQASIRLGAAPDADFGIDMLPVDYVARAVAQIASQPDAAGRRFHLSSSVRVALPVLVDEVRAMGYPLELLPWTEWVARLRGVAPGDDAHGRVNALIDVTNPGQPARVMDVSQAEQALARADFRWPVIDRAILRRYVEHLARQGSIPAPPRS